MRRLYDTVYVIMAYFNSVRQVAITWKPTKKEHFKAWGVPANSCMVSWHTASSTQWHTYVQCLVRYYHSPPHVKAKLHISTHANLTLSIQFTLNQHASHWNSSKTDAQQRMPPEKRSYLKNIYCVYFFVDMNLLYINGESRISDIFFYFIQKCDLQNALKLE